jgi:hypothetical protein
MLIFLKGGLQVLLAWPRIKIELALDGNIETLDEMAP